MSVVLQNAAIVSPRAHLPDDAILGVQYDLFARVRIRSNCLFKHTKIRAHNAYASFDDREKRSKSSSLLHTLPSTYRTINHDNTYTITVGEQISIMSSSMAVDKPAPPKLDVDVYLSQALAATPAELHPFFQSFKDLHSRKYVRSDFQTISIRGFSSGNFNSYVVNVR